MSCIRALATKIGPKAVCWDFWMKKNPWIFIWKFSSPRVPLPWVVPALGTDSLTQLIELILEVSLAFQSLVALRLQQQSPPSPLSPALQPLHVPQENSIIPNLQMENCTVRKATCLRKSRKSAVEGETEFKLCHTVQITGPVLLTDGDNNNFSPLQIPLVNLLQYSVPATQE